MSASVFSPSWYRVAGLVPRLRSHAAIHRQTYRGELWYLLQDRASGKFHRFSPAAHALIGLMDGRRSVDRIWHEAGERLGDDLPTQDETIRLLAQLYHANALVTDASPDATELAFRGQRLRDKQFWGQLRSPLALKIPLFDPDGFLDRTLPWVSPLLGLPGVVLWLSVVASGGVLAARYFDALSTDVTDRVLVTENLVLLWFVFPLVKVIHELGHAYAVKHGGGEVHEMGVMLLVGIPVPYVDATSSTAFQSRWQRAFVGAAGVIAELFVAALALFVWVAIEPGLGRAIAFNTVVIASVSSLVFNGNPFLRFDAYYVVSDLLEIPNLGTRANQYLGYWVQTKIFGVASATSPAQSQAEALWLTVYAIGSFVTRLLVMLSIALFIATKLLALGVLLAAWSVTQFAILPLGKQLWFLGFDPRLDERRGRAIGITLGVFGTLLFVVLFVPVPSWTRAEGIVWSPEHSQVRPEIDGTVVALLAEPGSRVEPGQPLFVLDATELGFERDAAEASLQAARARYDDERTRNLVEASITKQAIAQAEHVLARVQERIEGLTVRSPGEGELLLDPVRDYTGRFVRRGEILGYVTDFDPVSVRVVVPAADVDQVRSSLRRVDVRFAESVERVHSARLVSETPLATHDLPSPALAVQGGGQIALDPVAGESLRALQKYFVVDLEVEDGFRPHGIGERVYVRFAHAPETIAAQGLRAARRLFLSLFQV
jgi:putative peptide zinc metalloprotease protein